MKKRALIFGVNGFVGRYLVEELSSHGYLVSGSDRNTQVMYPKLLHTFYEVDITDEGAVSAAVQKDAPDLIVNLAAISSVGLSWKIPQATVDVNVIGAINIMEAARQLPKMPKLLIIGSSEEYAPITGPMSENSEIVSNNPYAVSKMAQERFGELYAAQYGLEVYRTRSFNHTGIGQTETFALASFCRRVAEIDKSGKPGVMSVGNLEARRDFSDVRDVVRAYRLVVENGRPGEIYNIGSGKAEQLGSLLEMIISFSSQNIEVEIDSEKLRPVDNPVICCDNSKAKEELGWEPEYAIKDTLFEMYTYHSRLPTS